MNKTANIVFELDEACAALRITEDERRFAVAAIVAAWEAQQEYLLFLNDIQSHSLPKNE